MTSTPPAAQSPFAVLQRFARPRNPAVERCEVCSAPLAPEHQHLIEPATRRLVCSCDACAVLFNSPHAKRYRTVPRRIEYLPQFQMSDVQWEGLHLPISLAFFYHSTPAGRVIAAYPSPAGATESLLTLEAWQELAACNPVLAELQPDVEALLANRVGEGREHFRVPIGECFRLVGLIRTHWRGLSGGTEMWVHIKKFFASLMEKSVPWEGGPPRA